MLKSLILLATVISTTFPAPVNAAAARDDYDALEDGILRALFSSVLVKLDTDGNEVISLEELRTLRDELQLQKYLDDEKVEEVLNQIDANKDHHISYEDLDIPLDMGLTSLFNRALSAVDRDDNRQVSWGEVEEYLKNRIEVGMGLPGLTEDLGNHTDVAAHIADVAAAFSRLDKDGDGRLSIEELGDLHYVKWHESFKSFDRNGDDQISFDEFKAPIKDIVQRVIHVVDGDGDEKISLEEIKNLANPDTLPDTIMKTIDVNGDGQFTYSEFKELNTDPNHLKVINDALNRLDNALNNGTVTSTVTSIDTSAAHLDDAPESILPHAIILGFVVLITLVALGLYYYKKSMHTHRWQRQMSMTEVPLS